LTPLLTPKTPQGEGGYGTLYREGGTPKGVYRGGVNGYTQGGPPMVLYGEDINNGGCG